MAVLVIFILYIGVVVLFNVVHVGIFFITHLNISLSTSLTEI